MGGGGVGLGAHAKYRIVSERTIFAMPETLIGLFPDVGMTWKLTQLKYPSAGCFLGLTGRRIGPVDCLRLGLATHFVKSCDLENVYEEICNNGSEDPLNSSSLIKPASYFDNDSNVEEIRKTLNTTNNSSSSSKNIINFQPEITTKECLTGTLDYCFGLDSVSTLSECIEKLKERAASGCPIAKNALEKLIPPLSPLSLRVTWDALRNHRNLSLREAFIVEYRMAIRSLRSSPLGDFEEGVTARLIEKREAKWAHKGIDFVPDEVINGYFKPLDVDIDGEKELEI